MGDGVVDGSRLVCRITGRDMPLEAIDIADNHRPIEREPLVDYQIFVDMIDADDVRNRTANGAARGAQALHRDRQARVRPEDLGHLGAARRRLRQEQQILDDLLITAPNPDDRHAVDPSLETSEHPHVEHR
jgi:hypothetical protein